MFVPIALGHTHPVPEIPRAAHLARAAILCLRARFVYFAVWIGLSQALTSADARFAKDPTRRERRAPAVRERSRVCHSPR